MNMSTPTPKNQMTRRQFLARTGALGALGLSLPAFLAACGGSDSSSGGGSESLFFDNWPLYVDPTADGLTGTVDPQRFSRCLEMASQSKPTSLRQHFGWLVA